MADLRSISGGHAGRLRSELADLGGLADDDSFRLPTAADALDALASLIDEHDTLNIRGEKLASLVKLIADDVRRASLRQSLDAAQR